MENEEKAKEIANNCSTHIVGAEVSNETYITTEPDCYRAAIEMAKWKDKQFKEYFVSVLSIKFLYFLNEKEKRGNTVVDKIDWKKTVRDFMNYLKQQE